MMAELALVVLALAALAMRTSETEINKKSTLHDKILTSFVSVSTDNGGTGIGGVGIGSAGHAHI